MKVFECIVCGKKYTRRGKNPKSNFCSLGCKYLYQKTITGKEHPRWKKDYIRIKECENCGKVFTCKNPTTLQRMKFCSKQCADVGGFRYRGKNHPNWNGGRRSGIIALRTHAPYKKWSRDVLKRDDYTCVFCGKRGGNLHAHHLKSFSDFSEIRYELNNGITLCVSCHAKVHRPKIGKSFMSTVENGVNSVKLLKGQYRAKPEREGVEVNPEIMDINALAENQLCKI